MARLIDADALLEKFNKKTDLWTALTDEDTANDFAFYSKLADAVDEAPTVGGWVRVKDMLPKKKGDYLIYNTDGTVWPYWYDADDNSWYDSCGYKTDIVTHWMPMPSAEGLNET